VAKEAKTEYQSIVDNPYGATFVSGTESELHPNIKKSENSLWLVVNVVILVLFVSHECLMLDLLQYRSLKIKLCCGLERN